MTEPSPGRTVVDQIRRAAASFTAVAALVVVSAVIGGYILAQEGLTLPGWVPFLGTSFYTVRADFQTAQAVMPGQGQAVTIAGVKVGIISGVGLSDGVAVVTMRIDRQYSPVYRDATMLLRPKSALDDMTVELDKGTPAAGALPSGGTLPIAQTAPDVNLDELLASLDGDTRSYLQELLGSAGPALNGRGTLLSAALRRLDPTTHDLALISHQLVGRRQHVGRVVHNLAILTAAIGTRDTQLADLVRASNAVLQTVAQENADVSATLGQLPGTLTNLRSSLGQLTTTAQLANSALGSLRPSARALVPALPASQTLFDKTTPVLRDQIGPFARAAQPTVTELTPAARSLAAATPNLTSTFGVLNTFLDELAYNPGASRPGYLFYLGWAAHDLDSVLSTGDANGALLRAEFLFSPSNVPVICLAEKGTPPAAVLVQLLALPQCKTGSGS